MLHRDHFRLLILALLVLCGNSVRPLWGHPGHGHPELDQTPLHYIVEPQHGMLFLVGMGVALGALLWGIVRRFRTSK